MRIITQLLLFSNKCCANQVVPFQLLWTKFPTQLSSFINSLCVLYFELAILTVVAILAVIYISREQ